MPGLVNDHAQSETDEDPDDLAHFLPLLLRDEPPRNFVRSAASPVRTHPAAVATKKQRIDPVEAIMDTRVVLAGCPLAKSAREAASFGAATYPTATPQARASNEAMEVAFDRVGAALGAFRDAQN
jgi:hypothetical protein